MNSFRRLVRPRFLTIAAIFASLCAPFALAATPAETYLQQNIQKGLAILQDKGAAEAQTDLQFRGFLESLTDIKRVALFTLGPVSKTAAPADVDAFTAAFHDYIIAVYQSQLSHYTGEALIVTGSTEHAPGDFIVATKIGDASGKIANGAEEVDFRVEAVNGGFEVLDASVGGIWLATNERDQFMAFLARHNNDVAALTAHVKEVTSNMRAK